MRATIYNYFTEADIEEFFEFLKDNYKEDMRLTQWLGDHILGKPAQAIEADVNHSLTLSFDPTFNAPTRTPEENSK